MSTNSLNSDDNQDSGKSSAWSAFSSKFQDLKQKTRNKQIELSNYARTKGSELAVYANQQSRNIMQKMKKGNYFQYKLIKWYFAILLNNYFKIIIKRNNSQLSNKQKTVMFLEFH